MKLWRKFLRWLCLTSPRPVENFSATNTGRITEGDKIMERYTFAWQPSPDNFVEKHNLVTKLNAGGETVGPDLPASALEVDEIFETGTAVEAWLRTTGDNGSVADSNHVTFTALSEAQIRPVVGFTATWKEHVA